MAEIKDKCVFTVKQDQITLTTRTNGDRMLCKGMRIQAEDSAALAYMIQGGNELKIVVKEA